MVTHAHLFMSSIQFILSGFTWPYYAMPPWVRPLVYCFPIFHMNSLLRKVALDGAGPVLVMQHLLPLLVWLPVSMAWGYWGVRKQMVRTGRANML
jgi:ABC-2 type transport system permease protein